MSIRAFVLAIVGICVAGFFWIRAEQRPTPAVNVSNAPAAQTPRQDTAGARTYSSKQPLLVAGGSDGLRDLPPSDPPAKPAVTRAAASRIAAKDEAAAVRPIVSDTSAKRISSTKPGDAEARDQLVRDIQYELKRAGCYDGDVSGAWNNTTRQAMQTFTQRMNAALPVDQPDYVLLTLLQAQKAQSCKTIAQPPGGSYVATSGQQPNQNLLSGRMSAGASMVGQDLPAAPQTQDGVASITDTRPHVERRQPPRVRSSASAPRGSTRQVFNKMMLNAP